MENKLNTRNIVVAVLGVVIVIAVVVFGLSQKDGNAGTANSQDNNSGAFVGQRPIAPHENNMGAINTRTSVANAAIEDAQKADDLRSEDEDDKDDVDTKDADTAKDSIIIDITGEAGSDTGNMPVDEKDEKDETEESEKMEEDDDVEPTVSGRVIIIESE